MERIFDKPYEYRLMAKVFDVMLQHLAVLIAPNTMGSIVSEIRQ